MALVMTIEEREGRLTDITARLEEIDRENSGSALSTEDRDEWNKLSAEREEHKVALVELRARRKRIAELADSDDSREDGSATFNVQRPGSVRGDAIYDLSSIRTSMADPEAAAREMRDRAMRSVETAFFPHERANREECQSHIQRLLDTVETQHGDVARHLLVTGSPTYKRAFGKYLQGKPRTQEEEAALSRALSLTGASGGFAIPFTLDPSIIPTSNLSVNPYRRIARVVQGVTDDWKGVSSAGVTASYGAEVTEATDNAPTLAQPAVSSEKAQAFIPYSIEVGMDWGALQSEMAALFQDAKDDLEANKFTLGSGTNEPFGLITGATTLTTAGGTASFAVADVYAVEQALGPRFRGRAQWVANRFAYNKVRQFDTSGGASLWAPLPAPLQQGLANEVPRGGNTGYNLIGYPANECSSVASVLTTGTKIAVLGDFNYFIIYDRIGMSVETIPHLFGVSGRPLGQRGLYAYWRNTSKVLDANAFRTIITG